MKYLSKFINSPIISILIIAHIIATLITEIVSMLVIDYNNTGYKNNNYEY